MKWVLCYWTWTFTQGQHSRNSNNCRDMRKDKRHSVWETEGEKGRTTWPLEGWPAFKIGLPSCCSTRTPWAAPTLSPLRQICLSWRREMCSKSFFNIESSSTHYWAIRPDDTRIILHSRGNCCWTISRALQHSGALPNFISNNTKFHLTVWSL